MRFLIRAALALMAFCATAGPAAAAQRDPLEAGLSWHLAFGGKTLQAGYDLSLGFRSAEPLATASRIVALKVEGASAIASLAGVPIAARSYQSSETRDPAAADASADQPWFTHSWVLWTLGGLAATAAAVASGGGSYSSTGSSCSGTCNQQCAANGGVSNCGGTTTVADQQVPTVCTPAGPCVNCRSTTVGINCGGSGWAVDPAEAIGRGFAWVNGEPDAGTGGMGDLIAR